MHPPTPRLTRGMLRRMAAGAPGGSGLHTDVSATAPPSVESVASHETPPAAEIGPRRVDDILLSRTLTPARDGSQTSRTSRASQRIRIQQVELQAQVELAKLREDIIKKQMALRIAEIQADDDVEERDRGSSLDQSERVDAWLSESASVVGLPAPRVEPVQRTSSAPLPSALPLCGEFREQFVRGNSVCSEIVRGEFAPATTVAAPWAPLSTWPPRGELAVENVLCDSVHGNVAPAAAEAAPRPPLSALSPPAEFARNNSVACGTTLERGDFARGNVAPAVAEATPRTPLSAIPPQGTFASNSVVCGTTLARGDFACGNVAPAVAMATARTPPPAPQGVYTRASNAHGNFTPATTAAPALLPELLPRRGDFAYDSFARAAAAPAFRQYEQPRRGEYERAEALHPVIRNDVVREPPMNCQENSTLIQLTEAINNLARPRPMPRQAYELPRFDGNPGDWLNFKRSYEKSTAAFRFPSHENIGRIQAALSGEAKTAVEDILPTTEDPDEVMKTLEEEFGNPSLLLDNVMRKVRALPRLTGDSRELRKFSATVRNCVSTLRNIGAVGYLHNPNFTEEVLAKLSPLQRDKYGEFIVKLDRERGTDSRLVPDLGALVDYLSHIALTASHVMPIGALKTPAATQPANVSRGRELQQRRVVQRVHTQVAATSQPTRNDGTKDEVECPCCKGTHALPKCAKFRELTVDERWELVKKSRLCFKCIERGHNRFKCRAKRCDVCNYRHHKLLHQDAQQSVNVNAVESEDDGEAPEDSVENVTNLVTGAGRSLLKVIPVTILTEGTRVSTYALLDDGATVSLLDATLVKDAKGPVSSLTVLGASGQCAVDRNSRRERVIVCGPNGREHEISVRTMKDLNLPAQSMPAEVLNCAHLRGLDCCAMENAKPMLLLGQDNWQLLVGWEIRRGKSGLPVASNTSLGWVVHGPMGSRVGSPVESVYHLREEELHDLVQRQFDLEAIGVSQVPRKNADSERALGTLDSTCKKTKDGCWEVGLLWKKDGVILPDNYDQAFKRLLGIERKMDRNPVFAEAYCSQMDRLFAEGYAKEVGDGFDASPRWYLPHFGVLNPNKPGKLRLVFDAAAKYKGACLNDNLLSGPDLLTPLPKVLMNFRLGRIGFSGDIADMFLRVKVREQDQGAQRFLWRGNDRNREPKTCVMTSMIFGAASSPTSAIYVLNKNAREYEDSDSEAVHAIANKHYMDDYLDSVETVEQAHRLVERVTAIHSAGGFVIRGWVTNSPELRERLVTAAPDRVKLEKTDSERTLGLIWSPVDDTFTFDLSFKRLPPGVVSGKVTPTKREFLSFIMSIFDPLGFLYPCVIQSRILMQRVWRSQIGWDDELGNEEAAEWFRWLAHLSSAPMIKVPRWYGIELSDLELHVFGDASELAYAAVAYVVGANDCGNREVAFVAGKARVAPVKVTSVPRLELQAAVLATRLANMIARDFGPTINNTYMWTDSKTVLNWINSDARDYPRFISHRLGEIDQGSVRGSWRWVPTADNPADEATKMNWPDKVSMWLSGPPFLRNLSTEWPVMSADASTEGVPCEVERACIISTTPTTPSLMDYARFSTWGKAVRAMARALVFVARCRRHRVSPDLTPDDLAKAEQSLLQQAQNETFPVELRALRAGSEVPRSSKIRKLDPILFGDDRLLRVRGRLSAAPELTFGERHPVLLDGHHPLAHLLVEDYHRRAHHAHHEAVVNAIRERFWMTRLRPTVRSVAHKCRLCRLRRAQPVAPKMGDLPAARVTDTRRAFVHCGVDYFGPMSVTVGRRREKRWGVLFTCLATRAVHLDLAATLSADSVILALRRLIARRGQPTLIWSDRGTNFVGATAELRVALQDLRQDDIAATAMGRGIEWRFNPPAAPHMGGSWERLVRAVKHALRITLRERAPREEVLMTLLLEAELVVNSRPLTYVADDPKAPVAITPNHLLLGTASGAAPFARTLPRDVDARSQWRRVNALADEFWRRWRREYLPTLQRREKWTHSEVIVKCGDVCVIADNTLPRNVWPIGIVTKVHPGPDGRVRIISIKTQSGTLRRPLTGVVVLPE